MIQMLGQVVLSAVLIVWGYQVASRVGRRPTWLWPGVGASVVFGFLALTAVYVAEGASASIRNLAAIVASVLYGIVVALVVALFVAVSRAATRPVPVEPEVEPPRSLWEPKVDDEPPVIVDDTWHPGSVIDAGTAPRRAARAYEEPLEHKFVPPVEPVAEEEPEPMFVAPAEPAAVDEPTPAHRPEPPLPNRAAEASADSPDDADADDADDDEAWEQIKPRRAMSATPMPDSQDDW
jgi:hypothetical protein